MEMNMAGASTASETDLHEDGQIAPGYKRIGELAEEFGVTLRTLRFYEDKGLLSPLREGNTRLYDRRDQTRLKLILLGRKVGFSLREVKQMMDLYEPAGSNVRQLKVTLEKSERQMARLQAQREALDEAIGELSGAMDTVRSLLSERTGAAGAA
ncbi:MAG: MerR family DNA-binding transcriptional regulator [Brucellaceae bacterium]|nr:MerR family DNA-binding transcriptional regulator [Notoacmeibacter sp.]MCC0025435.1 MerR family DNA-binding transcriptional regulator [Brucellaceae bacterium]